jgi:hypothetical protein
VPSDGSDNRSKLHSNHNNNNRNATIRVFGHGKIVDQLASSLSDSILIGEKARVKQELQWEIARGKELSDETIRAVQLIAQD